MPQTPHTRRASPDSGLQPVLDTTLSAGETSGAQEDESPSKSTGSSEFTLLIRVSVPLMALFHCMVRHGTVRYGSLLGGFPLGTVPGTFLLPPQPVFQAIRTVTKT